MNNSPQKRNLYHRENVFSSLKFVYFSSHTHYPAALSLFKISDHFQYSLLHAHLRSGKESTIGWF